MTEHWNILAKNEGIFNIILAVIDFLTSGAEANR